MKQREIVKIWFL